MLSLTAQSCVIFLTDDTAKTGLNKPLMLQNIMGTALLSWLSLSLKEKGVSRFFLLCPEQYREEALRCFPSSTEVTAAAGEGASDQMHVFLSTAPVEEKEVTVITQPVLLLPKSATPDFRNAPVPTRAFAVNRRALMDALDDRFSFQDFFAENGRPMTDRDGWYSISDAEALADWQAILNRENLCRLVREGVEVWDYRNTYVDADVFVGKGTVLLPGTVLKNGTVVGRNCRLGPNTLIDHAKIDDGAEIMSSNIAGAIIGAGTSVGPFANVGAGTVVGKHCRMGSGAQVKNSTIGDDVTLYSGVYLSDCDLGVGVCMGANAVTAHYDREGVHRTVVGDNSFVGANVTLVAPVTVGRGAYIAAGSVVSQNVPDDALGVARSNQSAKKDWAKSHKVKP